MEWITIASMIIASVAVSVALSVIIISAMRKKIIKDAMYRGIMMYKDILHKAIDGMGEMCPKCAFSANGKMCDRPDYQNLCAYGRCTRFEERRY